MRNDAGKVLRISTPRRAAAASSGAAAASARTAAAPAAATPLRKARAAGTPRDGAAVARPHHATIALVQSNSLPMLVQRELERRILAGELAPGSKLSEAALAEALGISRGPLREAFRALEESGLVRLEKNRGVRVRQVSVEEADEIYELRAVLDEFVGRRVAQVIDPEGVRELRTLVAGMEKAAQRQDVDAYLAANVAFHDRLVELAGNAKLLATYRRLVNELHLFRRANLAEVGALPMSAREHRQIVDRIAARDAEAAGRALAQHAQSSQHRMHRTHPPVPARRAPAARKSR